MSRTVDVQTSVHPVVTKRGKYLAVMLRKADGKTIMAHSACATLDRANTILDGLDEAFAARAQELADGFARMCAEAAAQVTQQHRQTHGDVRLPRQAIRKALADPIAKSTFKLAVGE